MSRWADSVPQCPRDELLTSLSSSQFIIRKLQEMQPQELGVKGAVRRRPGAGADTQGTVTFVTA